MEKQKCQMTISSPTYPDGAGGYVSYFKCGKPAKYRNPAPTMGVEYVCGIHARSLNIMFERIGSSKRCQTL